MRGIEAKVVILGSKNVGKTSLVTKYIKNALHKDVGPTIAASFFTCKVMLDDVQVKLQIWDTAGQERFKAVAPMYYRNANAAILVFDLSQYRTFQEIKSWMQELHRNVQDPLILTLVGNKLDLSSSRSVSREEACLLANSVGATYFETSAVADQGLHQIFFSTALGISRLASEGKCRSLKHFDSSESIGAYTNGYTAFSYMALTKGNLHNSNSISDTCVPSLPVGIPVEDDAIAATAEGRLETPSWSIEHIALGEVEPVSWCC